MDQDNVEKVITRLLPPINSKLDALPTTKDIESSLQAFRKELSHVEAKVEQVHGEVNDLAQYIRCLDLRIFGVPISSVKDLNMERWVTNYFEKDLGVELPNDAIERAHRTGRVVDGKVQIIVRFNSWKTDV